MGLLELIFEPMNPGPVGTIDTPGLTRKPVNPVWALFKFIMVMVLIGMILALPVLLVDATTICTFWIFMALLIYVLLSLFIVPRPDMKNLGWAGGLIDNPLRYSDDINRSLLMLKILLLPGRFIAFAFIDLFRGFVNMKK